MQAQFEAREFASTDALWSVASYVAKEYGSHGYRIGIAAGGFDIYVFEVAASDGSRFNVVGDRWGNVERIPDGATTEEAQTQINDMARRVVAADPPERFLPGSIPGSVPFPIPPI